ncbi:MAG: hypothetical protein ACLPV4_08740 [Solirubrobacteraceae bacterium]
MTESESGGPAPTEPDGAQTGGEPADAPETGGSTTAAPDSGSTAATTEPAAPAPATTEAAAARTGAAAPAAATTEAAVPAAAATATAGAKPPVGRGRRIWVQVIIWGTTILAVVAIFSVWANRQLLNPDNWANTSTSLLQRADIRTATSNYLVNQLYQNVNVAGELRTKLPPALQPIAGPVAGALRNVAVAAGERVLANPQVQQAWRLANKAAAQTLVRVVNGGSGALHVNGGRVTLDLRALVADVANQLGLPDVSSKLPPSVANLEILDSKQIGFVQTAGRALKGLALLLTIIVPLLYALAIFLARGRRRRALMEVGIAIVAAGLVVFAARKIVESGVTNSLVKDAANRPAASDVISIATSMLPEIAGAFLFVGIPLIVAAWFAGPARLATRGRRAIAPFLADNPVAVYGIVAAILILIFIWGPIPATHRPAGIIVFTVLAFAGTEVLRRQTAREFPPASAGAAALS